MRNFSSIAARLNHHARTEQMIESMRASEDDRIKDNMSESPIKKHWTGTAKGSGYVITEQELIDACRRSDAGIPEPDADTELEKARDELHDAAREMCKEWLKAPRDSSFDAWFAMVEKLEQRAIEFADAKRKYDLPGQTIDE